MFTELNTWNIVTNLEKRQASEFKPLDLRLTEFQAAFADILPANAAESAHAYWDMLNIDESWYREIFTNHTLLMLYAASNSPYNPSNIGTGNVLTPSEKFATNLIQMPVQSMNNALINDHIYNLALHSSTPDSARRIYFDAVNYSINLGQQYLICDAADRTINTQFFVDESPFDDGSGEYPFPGVALTANAYGNEFIYIQNGNLKVGHPYTKGNMAHELMHLFLRSPSFFGKFEDEVVASTLGGNDTYLVEKLMDSFVKSLIYLNNPNIGSRYNLAGERIRSFVNGKDFGADDSWSRIIFKELGPEGFLVWNMTNDYDSNNMLGGYNPFEMLNFVCKHSKLSELGINIEQQGDDVSLSLIASIWEGLWKGKRSLVLGEDGFVYSGNITAGELMEIRNFLSVMKEVRKYYL